MTLYDIINLAAKQAQWPESDPELEGLLSNPILKRLDYQGIEGSAQPQSQAVNELQTQLAQANQALEALQTERAAERLLNQLSFNPAVPAAYRIELGLRVLRAAAEQAGLSLTLDGQALVLKGENVPADLQAFAETALDAAGLLTRPEPQPFTTLQNNPTIPHLIQTNPKTDHNLRDKQRQIAALFY